MKNDLKQLQNHFAFGENWQSFVNTVDPDSIAGARYGLSRLLAPDTLRGRRFLDIGCGSGLSMLAALQLGAGKVRGIDIDPNSVAAAQTLLTRHAADGRWDAGCASVFDLRPDQDGEFDIVYSWGVLHHTGDMWTAIRNAAALVAPGGHFVIALYRKTPLDGFWIRLKRFYAASGKPARKLLSLAYQALFYSGLLAAGRNPWRYVRDYKSARGMNWANDIHDWLGGYPYESVAPGELSGFLRELGFEVTQVHAKPAAAGGLFGSHCDEFVAVRR